MANIKSTRTLVSTSGANLTAGGQNTVEFWMYWRGGTGNYMPFSWADYDLYFAGTHFGINTNNSDILGVPSTDLAKKWVHVAAVFYNGVPNASNTELYLNGIKQTITQRLGSPLSRTATAQAFVGGFYSSAAYLFSGYIKNFRVWNKKLSASEVVDSMNKRGAITGDGLVAQLYAEDVENVAPQYDLAQGYNTSGTFNPAAMLSPNTGYGFDDSTAANAGFIYQWEVPVRFTRLRFKSHPSYPIRDVSIYVEESKVASIPVITNEWTEVSGSWMGRSVSLVRAGTGDQTIQQVEFYGDVLNPSYINTTENLGDMPSWYIYNMQLLQIDNTLDLIGDTGHGGNDIWKMRKSANIGGTVQNVRSYPLTGFAYSTTHPDCIDYSPWNGYLYAVHDENPYVLYKYQINKNGETWTLSQVANYSLTNPTGEVLSVWAGAKFSINKQTNDGYIYLLTRTNTSSAKLYRLKVDTSGTPEFVTDVPWSYGMNIGSFAVTDEFLFLPTTANQLGCYSKKDGHLVNIVGTLNGGVNSYFNATSYRYDGNLYVMANGYQYAVMQVLVSVRRADVINFKATPQAVARQDYAVTGKITHKDNLKCAYKVLVNGAVKADVGLSSTPLIVDHYFLNKDLNVGVNSVTIEVTDEKGQMGAQTASVIKENTSPSQALTASSLTCHKENVTLEVAMSDVEKDMVKFKIELNGAAAYPESDFTALMKTPFTYVYTIRNRSLVIGDNVVKVTTVDEYGAAVVKTLTIQRQNNSVVIEDPAVRGQTVFARLSDADGDMICYKVLVNNAQVYPPSVGAWTPFLSSPAVVEFKIPKEHLDFGNTHKVEIVAEDDMGAETSWVTTTLIDYAGLMFMGEDGLYYSSDIGEVLKYLDAGKLVAGNVSDTYKVYLKNTVGYTINNIHLTVVQRDLDAVEEKVEISFSSSPFDPKTTLSIPTMKHGDRVPFYVRINTTRKAIGGGFFDIRVVGDPA